VRDGRQSDARHIRLDALTKIGALTYGEAHLNADADAKSDIMNGDYSFMAMPLAEIVVVGCVMVGSPTLVTSSATRLLSISRRLFVHLQRDDHAACQVADGDCELDGRRLYDLL